MGDWWITNTANVIIVDHRNTKQAQSFSALPIFPIVLIKISTTSEKVRGLLVLKTMVYLQFSCSSGVCLMQENTVLQEKVICVVVRMVRNKYKLEFMRFLWVVLPNSSYLYYSQFYEHFLDYIYIFITKYIVGKLWICDQHVAHSHQIILHTQRNYMQRYMYPLENQPNV